MKMKLLGSPRMQVLVMLLALTGLSAAQEEGSSTPATPAPLFVAKISLFPDNCASPTGNKTITFFAGGGLQPYTYTISSSATIPTTQTQTGLLVGTPATFTYAGTDTGDITYTITDEAGTMITGTFDVEEASVTSGQAEVDICFSPNTVNVSSALPGTATLTGFPLCSSINSQGGCTFSSLTTGNNYELDITLASSGCTYPTSTLKFQMPQINPLSFFAGPYTCQSMVVRAVGGSGYYGLLGVSQSPINFSFPLAVNNLPVGTYTLGLVDAISTACTPQPASQQLIIYPAPTLVSGYPQATATSCGLNNGTITAAVTGGSGSYTAFADGYVHGLYFFPPFVNGSSTVTNLPADTYDVAITDTTSGCSINPQVPVGQGSTLGLSATPTAPSCFGGAGILQYTVTESNPAAVTTVTVTETTSGYSNTFMNPMTFPLIATITSPAFTAGAVYNLTATDTQPASTVNCAQSFTGAIPAAPGQLTATASVTQQVSCDGGNNGAITATATGGAAPYTYVLSTGVSNQTGLFNNLTAGLYTVSVADKNNCGPVTASATISQPTQQVISVTKVTSPTCAGSTNGSLAFSVSGGTAPYTATLSGGATTVQPITNIPAGKSELFSGLAASANPYSITVTDANGCVVNSGSITLSATDQINITASSTSPTCSGGTNGSITFTVTNAVPNSTVVLKNNNGTTVKTVTGVSNGVHETISSLGAGLYSITTTDSNGCSSTIPVNIPSGSLVMITAPVVSPILCNGGTATVSFTLSGGTAPYRSCLKQNNQSFSSCILCKDGACNAVQSITGVPAGNYELVVTDANGCSASVAITVTQPQPVNFSIQTSSNSCPRNQSQLTVNATGGTAPYRYQLDGGTVHQGGSSYSFGCVANGSHTVTVTDANGCMKTARVSVS